MKSVAVALEHELKHLVFFASDCVGPVAKTAVAALRNGDILLLENTRFHAGEIKNDPAFVEQLAELGDIYVNDAFSTSHRAHASTEGIAHKLPAFCRPHHAARTGNADHHAGLSRAAHGGDRWRR